MPGPALPTSTPRSRARCISRGAAYAAQKDAQLLQLTFRGQHGKSYELTLTETETGKQAKFQLAFDFRFADVMDENAWYYDAVYAAYDAGLMNGVGEGLFAPNATLDRATLASRPLS